MYVRGLELVDFRSYGHAVVEFEPGPNALVGPNGVGKTNLIEAVHYIAALSSHRVAVDAPLVRSGASRAVIRCAIVHEGRELLVELAIEPGKSNRARLGRSPVTRPRDVLGALRLVLFAPEDLALVRGDPEQRRRFLDELLVTRQPRYAGIRADYDRVLRQRNALLRSAYLARKVGGNRGGDLSTLDVWDVHLAEHGARLLSGRLELCAALDPYLAEAYRSVSHDALEGSRRSATLTYVTSLGDNPPTQVPQLQEHLASALAEQRPNEIERGTTLVGPHRDEVLLSIGDLPVKGYASHGESWSFALAMRLAAYHLLRAEGTEPVLVLDDVFAELDAGRRQRLSETVSGAAQLLVTCAVEEDLPPVLRERRYLVGAGEVRRV